METVVRISMICYRATLTYTQDLHTRHGRVNIVCPRYERNKKGGRSFADLWNKLWTNYPTNFARKNLFYAKAY